MTFALPRLLGAAFLSLSLACSQGQGQVARVGGESISVEEFERQLRILKSLRPETEINELTRRQVLDQMAKQLLLSQEAKKAGLDKDLAVQEALSRQREAVRRELEESIENAQAQLQQLDKAVEQKVLIERLLHQRRGGLTVTAKELEAAYDARKAQSPGTVPPFMQIRDQLLDQVLVEKLVEQLKPGVPIELFPEAAARSGTGN